MRWEERRKSKAGNMEKTETYSLVEVFQVSMRASHQSITMSLEIQSFLPDDL